MMPALCGRYGRKWRAVNGGVPSGSPRNGELPRGVSVDRRHRHIDGEMFISLFYAGNSIHAGRRLKKGAGTSSSDIISLLEPAEVYA